MHSISCISDINDVLKQAGTSLSDDTNNLIIFFVWLLWFRELNCHILY
jgi:hypothetical protein